MAAPRKAALPQGRLCPSVGSLHGGGRAFAVCQKCPRCFAVTFKEGRPPEPWREFEPLLKFCPRPKRTVILPDKTRRVYRRGEQLPRTEGEKRARTRGAILCEEASAAGAKIPFAGLTNVAVRRDSVIAPAGQVKRLRQKIENEGFNVQKSSGLSLGHVFRQNRDHAQGL